MSEFAGGVWMKTSDGEEVLVTPMEAGEITLGGHDGYSSPSSSACSTSSSSDADDDDDAEDYEDYDAERSRSAGQKMDGSTVLVFPPNPNLLAREPSVNDEQRHQENDIGCGEGAAADARKNDEDGGKLLPLPPAPPVSPAAPHSVAPGQEKKKEENAPGKEEQAAFPGLFLGSAAFSVPTRFEASEQHKQQPHRGMGLELSGFPPAKFPQFRCGIDFGRRTPPNDAAATGVAASPGAGGAEGSASPEFQLFGLDKSPLTQEETATLSDATSASGSEGGDRDERGDDEEQQQPPAPSRHHQLDDAEEGRGLRASPFTNNREADAATTKSTQTGDDANDAACSKGGELEAPVPAGDPTNTTIKSPQPAPRYALNEMLRDSSSESEEEEEHEAACECKQRKHRLWGSSKSKKTCLHNLQCAVLGAFLAVLMKCVF